MKNIFDWFCIIVFVVVFVALLGAIFSKLWPLLILVIVAALAWTGLDKLIDKLSGK